MSLAGEGRLVLTFLSMGYKWKVLCGCFGESFLKDVHPVSFFFVLLFFFFLLFVLPILLIQAGHVWGPRGDPSGPAKRVPGQAQDGNQTGASRRWKRSLLKVESECRCRQSAWETQEGKERKRHLCSGSGFLLRTVWSSQAFRTSQNKGEGPGLFLGARGCWRLDV